jgi:catechol 2,3-dioxygenase-like lactoylglutathione lyase family enzyme
MASITRIDIVSIPVSDQAAAKVFYTDVLGFEVVRDNPMGPEQRWIQLSPPGAETSITLVTWLEAMPAGSVKGLVLSCDDIDGMHRALADRVVDLSDIAEEPWGRYATFADPDGNGWVLVEPAA